MIIICSLLDFSSLTTITTDSSNQATQVASAVATQASAEVDKVSVVATQALSLQTRTKVETSEVRGARIESSLQLP